MALGDIIGLSGRLPQEQVQLPGYESGQGQAMGRPNQGAGQAPQGFEVPEFLQNPAEGLQYTQNLTKDYYDKFMGVRSFAETMWQNFKIDVTKPNLGDPEQMKYHDIYQKAVADIMYTGDILKNSQEQLGKMNQGAISGDVRFNEGFDPSAAPVSTQDPRSMVTSTAKSEIVKEAEMMSQALLNNPAQFSRSMETWQQGMDAIDAKIKSDPSNAQYWLNQKEAMRQLEPRRTLNSAELENMKTPKPGKDEGLAQDLTKRVVNMFAGTSTDMTKGPINPETGSPTLKSTAFTGNYGDGEIDYVTHDTEKSNAVTVHYKGDKSPTVVTEPLDFLSTYITSNPRFAVRYEDIFYKLQAEGKVDQEGRLRTEQILPPGYQILKKGNKEKIKEAQQKAQTQKKNLESKIDKIVAGNKTWFNNLINADGLTLPLEDGANLEVEITGTGPNSKFKVTNAGTLFSAPVAPMNPAQFKKWLYDQGVYDALLDTEMFTDQQTQAGTESAPVVIQENDSITDVSNLFK